ncbi:NACHT domain-containing protein [Hyphomonas sp. FCG-A18]|uniref:NACHT domain-containing protein n=1 Tax=Hyphomonas sp. FCG-A18 TaxID=3080019 RepID=UPI002B2F8106|nr:NACHT domain-containing protein [Hyphomonas sp. FCG-A18]
MTESGGTAAQAGIMFQNSIAALYLGRMLDLTSRRLADQVLKVRVEAPEPVDDIVVGMADGSREFVQAKLTLKRGSKAWKKLWSDFDKQIQQTDFTDQDKLVLIIGENNALGRDLRGCAERADSAETDAEFEERLNDAQNRVFQDVVNLTLGSDARELFRRMDVRLIPFPSIDRDYAPQWMPKSSMGVAHIFDLLCLEVSKRAHSRESYTRPKIAEILFREHGIVLDEPTDWGASVYRAAIKRAAYVTIPGTNFSRSIDEAFPWPVCSAFSLTERPDFDDETPSHLRYEPTIDVVDISNFPDASLNRVTLVGGAGLGKSVLAKALAAKNAASGLLPVVIAIADFARTEFTIGEYLAKSVNRSFEVEINWSRACDAGLVVLILDGLDEVSADARVSVLERIKTFDARHREVPWMLIVRDASAVALPLETTQIEVQPLDRSGIERVVKFYRTDKPHMADEIIERLEHRPDLSRMIRIPLFLALLVTTAEDLSGLPDSRADILEAYLHILLKPEKFKITDGYKLDGDDLRDFSERIAFEALERDEIGVESRELRLLAKQVSFPLPTEVAFEGLVKCGLLRQASTIRYEFPFPIVQEYLASCFLVENRLDEIEERLHRIVKRPWAQTIQFALERHPNPESIADTLLAERDDAFSTKLRLLARCIGNGMKVTVETRAGIAVRLARVWRRSDWDFRNKIGSQIADAFFDPLVPEVEELLYRPRMLYAGSGKIVASINDAVFTADTLEKLLDNSDGHMLRLSELQAPVNRISETAFDLIINRATRGENGQADADDVDTMCACLIGHLNTDGVPNSKIVEAVNRTTLPLATRLACLRKVPDQTHDVALPLVESALATEGFEPKASALEYLCARSDAFEQIRTRILLVAKSIDDAEELFRDFSRYMDHRLFEQVASDDDIPDTVRSMAEVMCARHGDHTRMESLINRIPTLPVDVVSATLSLFGHHRSYALAERALEMMGAREYSVGERLKIAQALSGGLTSIFEMDAYFSGLINYCPPHPGLNLFEELLETWSQVTNFSELEQLHFDQHLARMGFSAALDRIPEQTERVLKNAEYDFQEHEAAGSIGDSLRQLSMNNRTMPLEFLERVIDTCSHNGAFPAYQMLEKIGSRKAFDLLLLSYNNPSAHAKSLCFESLERMASRLGLKIIEVDGGILEARDIG